MLETNKKREMWRCSHVEIERGWVIVFLTDSEWSRALGACSHPPRGSTGKDPSRHHRARASLRYALTP
jgi:hypothetical protein